MNADSNLRMQSEPSSEQAVAPPTPPREPLPRRIFVEMRLKEIATRIREMAQEREQLTVDLKNQPSDGGALHKGLRQRRLYIAERLTIIRKEQSDLIAEKKSVRAGG